MDFWLGLACFGLGAGFVLLLGRIIEARVRHLALSKQGKEGVALREQYRIEQAREERENGKEVALAIAQALTLRTEGKGKMEIIEAVAMEHPTAVWFVIQKVMSGELGMGELAKAKGLLSGGLGGILKQ